MRPRHAGAEARIAFLMALRAKGLRDTAVLRAFETVPRSPLRAAPVRRPRADRRRPAHRLRPDHARALADGRRCSSRSTCARSTGCWRSASGSGYGTAILARLAGEVVSIERYRSLAVEARGRLEAQGVGNAEILHGDGRLGHLAGMPFDRILIEASRRISPGRIAGAARARRADRLRGTQRGGLVPGAPFARRRRRPRPRGAFPARHAAADDWNRSGALGSGSFLPSISSRQDGAPSRGMVNQIRINHRG